VRLAVVKEIMDQPALLAVDRHHGAAAAWTERQITPATFAREHAHQPGRAKVGGLHALHDRHAYQLRADAVAHHRAAAVAAGEIAARDLDRLAGIEIARGG